MVRHTDSVKLPVVIGDPVAVPQFRWETHTGWATKLFMATTDNGRDKNGLNHEEHYNLA
jgi:hypothetical protein